MKKEYSKPQFVFESFELSQNIAGNCSVTAKFAQDECVVELGFISIFTDKALDCETTPTPDIYDSICYDVPNGDNLIFSS